MIFFWNDYIYIYIPTDFHRANVNVISPVDFNFCNIILCIPAKVSVPQTKVFYVTVCFRCFCYMVVPHLGSPLLGSGTLLGMQSESREWLNHPRDCGQSRKPRLSEFENLPKTLWHTKLLCCSNPVITQPQFSKPDCPWSQIPNRKSRHHWLITLFIPSEFDFVFVIVEYHKPGNPIG